MEEEVPNVREYVKIAGVWQHTDAAWYVDKERLKSAITQATGVPGQSFTYATYSPSYCDWECVAHVHHWKTALEEYCRIDDNWKCARCADTVPDSIQAMVKLYRPLKDV